MRSLIASRFCTAEGGCATRSAAGAAGAIGQEQFRIAQDRAFLRMLRIAPGQTSGDFSLGFHGTTIIWMLLHSKSRLDAQSWATELDK